MAGFFRLNTKEGTRGFPLTDPESPPEEVAERPLASSQSDWSVFAERRPSNASDQLLLRRSPEGAPRFRFGNDDPIGPGPIEFSQDGRHLSWCNQDGTITVADLPALERKAREFERAIAVE